MQKRAVNLHLFTPRNTGKMRRELGFQFHYKGTVDGEMLGHWAREGSTIRVERVKKDGSLVWQITDTSRPGWHFIRHDENKILDALRLMFGLSQTQIPTSSNTSTL